MQNKNLDTTYKLIENSFQDIISAVDNIKFGRSIPGSSVRDQLYTISTRISAFRYTPSSRSSNDFTLNLSQKLYEPNFRKLVISPGKVIDFPHEQYRMLRSHHTFRYLFKINFI